MQLCTQGVARGSARSRNDVYICKFIVHGSIDRTYSPD
jgi:hypothetical protein